MKQVRLKLLGIVIGLTDEYEYDFGWVKTRNMEYDFVFFIVFSRFYKN